MTSRFRIKSISSFVADTEKKSLQKTLTAFDLVLLGVGGTIGTGIFVVTGIAAAQHSGPAISLSYLLSAIVCVFAALAYTELASMIPVSGSAYTYSYATLGEFVAWLVACGLILEYTAGASTVATGWSGYFVGTLESGGIHVPDYLTKTPIEGGIINLPAVGITLFVGLLLMRGTRESLLINRVLVVLKLGIIFLFLLIAAPHIKMENYANFMPFGWHGVIVGAATIFFAYIGFDAVATTAEETKNPNRNLPIGIIGSLLACAVIYITVALALSGIANFSSLNNPEPMARALRENGSNLGSALVGTGAIAGMVTVLLALMYGQSRIFFVMSRDGLIPSVFSKLHKKFSTPHISCIAVTIVVMILSGFTPIQTMGHMTSLGALFAFNVSAIAVMVLRITKPELHRPFRCPAVFVVAPIAILSCSYFIYTLILETGKYFLIWSLLGIAFYFAYSYRKSPLNNLSKNLPQNKK